MTLGNCKIVENKAPLVVCWIVLILWEFFLNMVQIIASGGVSTKIKVKTGEGSRQEPFLNVLGYKLFAPGSVLGSIAQRRYG